MLEIGDISDEQAMKFLTARFASRGKSDDKVRQQAERAVKEVTGGRFELLLKYYKTGFVDFEAWRKMLDEKLKATLKDAGVLTTHPVFKHLVEKGACTNDDLDELGLSKQQLEALLAANVLAAHLSKEYTFHSRHVRTFFERFIEERKSWYSFLWRRAWSTVAPSAQQPTTRAESNGTSLLD